MTLFFFFLASPAACGSSCARDQTHTTAVTRATAVTTLDNRYTSPQRSSLAQMDWETPFTSPAFQQNCRLHPWRNNTCDTMDAQGTYHLFHICRRSSICCFGLADAERTLQSPAQPAASWWARRRGGRGGGRGRRWGGAGRRAREWDGAQAQCLLPQLVASSPPHSGPHSVQGAPSCNLNKEFCRNWRWRSQNPRGDCSTKCFSNEVPDGTKRLESGVPSVARRVKNLTAVAQFTGEVWVQSLAWHHELKYPMSPQLQQRSQPQLRISPWSGNLHMSQVWP